MAGQPSTNKPRAATFELPWPPSANTHWRSVVINGSVRVLLSKRGRHYRKLVRDALLDRFGPVDPLDFRVRVSLVAFAPDARKRDIDNILKPVLDALTDARFWSDDSLVNDLRVIRGPIARPHGRLEITVEEILQTGALF